MSHDLDITAGAASFVSAREDAWHKLGKTLPDTFTAEEAMDEGNLGRWNVRKEPIYTGSGLIIPGRNAVLRDNPVVSGQVDVIGDVGDGYNIIQNEAHAGLLNALVDESGAHFETAGALDGGRRVFITMKLPDHISVGGVDQVDTYIAAVNSHDGSMAFTLMVTPVRIRCKNTLNLAFSAASAMFRVRHTTGADRIILNEARTALSFTFDYLEGFQEQAEELINTTLTQSTFEEIIAAEYGAPEGSGKAAITRSEKKVHEIAQLFSDSPTQAPIRGTAWAGLNALTEWNDHFSPVRGDDRERTRAKKAILDPSFKNRALELMLAVR